MKKILFLLLIITGFSFTACNLVPPMTKGMYISQYESFIADVKANNEDYDAKTWEAKNDEFRKFSREYYEQYKTDLTDEESNRVTELKLKYFELKVKQKGKKFLDNLEDAILGD